MNKCSKCGRLVAGHLAKYGVPHGSKCTLIPLSETVVTSEGGHSSDMNGSQDSSLVETSIPQATSGSSTPTTSSPLSVAVTAGTPGTSVSSSESVTLTNEQIEAEFSKKYDFLRLQLQEAEAKIKQKTLDNILRLDEQNRFMQNRLELLNQSAQTATGLPINSSASAPPATSASELVSSLAHFAPPLTTAGMIASGFGQSNYGIPATHQATSQFIHGNPGSASSSFTTASLAFTTASVPSATSVGGIPHSAIGQSAASLQQPLGASQPQLSLHSSWPNIPGNTSNLQMAAGAASAGAFQGQNSQFTTNQAMSLPDLQSALLASNPQILSNLNVKPDDIIRVNSLARAMAGLSTQDVPKDDSVLGKYIPELYSIKYGKVEDIRARMTYHEFIAMYIRMLVTIMKDDPALLPDRLTFLNAITSKAARHKWPAVRNAYTSAMHQLKLGHRKWADDLTEVFADHLDTHTLVRSDHPPASGFSHHGPSNRTCRDWNERNCNRSVCKFLHECSRCHQDHPLKACPTTGHFANASTT